MKFLKNIKVEIKTADAVVKGQTASSSFKNASTTNELNILVPPHIKEGDKVMINSETLNYVEKSKRLMSFYSPLLNALNKSIRISGKKIIRDFGEVEKLQSSVKETTKFVSIVKSNLNKDITQILKKLRPDLTVESKNVNIKDCWILQILDSTTNFSRGIDNFFL